MESNTTDSKSSSWREVNWDALRRLRARFLTFDQTGADKADYWRSHTELASYDVTFGERIGWKWDALLAELGHRGWTLPAGTILDYGCGTGIAGRRVVAWAAQQGGELAPTDSDLRLILWDRSRNAMHFAGRRARETFPWLSVETGTPDTAASVLVVSHVVNELTANGLEQLLAAAGRAQAVLWVEPGTAAASRALIAVRERLLAAFHPVAPCPHAGRCGMLEPGNERHWCHHFARPPAAVFQDPGWGRFARMMEIDLGSVPFCCLVLDRRPRDLDSGLSDSRIIGVPRHYKGFARILCCQDDGVRELILQKRDAPELFKEMKKTPGSLYRWERDGDKICGGVRLW